jgi:hypothetical protein
MICCLCGEPLQEGDLILRLRLEKEIWSPHLEKFVRVQADFEDGSKDKTVHPYCPVEFGAPLSLVGADGGRQDV